MRRLGVFSRRLSCTPARQFRVLGLQQVAIGGLDKARLSGLWEGLLGVPKVGHFTSDKENVDEDILLLGRGPTAVELDLMQPIDPGRSPKVHVPPLNHIGIWVHFCALIACLLLHQPPHTSRRALACGRPSSAHLHFNAHTPTVYVLRLTQSRLQLST